MKKKISTFERQRTITGTIFLIPVFIFVAAFIIWPLIEVIQLSFTDWNGVAKTWNNIGFENYAHLTEIQGFWDMCKATVIFAIVVTILTIVVAFLVALVLDKKGPWRINRGLMRGLWFFPCLLSGTVVGILWRIMYNYNNGVLNTIIKSITGAKKGVNWLESPDFTIFCVIVACVWASTGMCIIIFLAGLQSIDESLYEAASIDGATKWQQITKITLPLLRPTMIMLTMLAVGRIFYSDFGLFYQVPQNSGALLSVTNTIDTYVYRGLLELGNITMSAAAGVYQSIVGFVLILSANMLVRRIDPESAMF